MSMQASPNMPSQMLIQLEILTAHAEDADLALVSAVGRDTIDELETAGYSTQPISTGQRGGGILVEVVTTLSTIASNAWANKESIERVITDAGGLVTVCSGIIPIAKTLTQVFKQRADASGNRQEPVKITIEIDGAPVAIEAADLEQAEAALKLAQRFHSAHTMVAQSVTPRSKVKLKAHLPKAPRRKRR